MVLGVLVPGLVSILAVYIFGWRARMAIKHFRERKYQTEVHPLFPKPGIQVLGYGLRVWVDNLGL